MSSIYTSVVYRTIPTSNHNPYLCTLKSWRVVYLTIPTSNHNLEANMNQFLVLYILLFLHQTTTLLDLLGYGFRLYILLFLHQTTTENELLSGCWMLYILLFLHQTTTLALDEHKKAGCISYYSYIKPQHGTWNPVAFYVVYLTIPTSNHNITLILVMIRWLYILLFLHQTTTHISHSTRRSGCISYYSYIKPQPDTVRLFDMLGCISYYSYIKPQPITTYKGKPWRCISYYSYIKPQLIMVI